MSLLTLPFKLPLLPLRAVIRLAEVIEEEAERQLADPARLRRQLEAIEQARRAGEITDDEAAELQNEVVASFTQARRSAAAPIDFGEG
jgi:Gas vesicle protein G